MSIRKIPTCEEAKQQIKLIDYLAALGYHPTNVNGHDFWYLSPLHDEKTASFKVNNKINAWKDWGGSKNDKGTLIDFGVKYHKCSVSEFLEKLSVMNFTPTRDANQRLPKIIASKEEPKIIITQVKELTSFALINYLLYRGIPQVIARRFCKEVNYRVKDSNKTEGKNYYAIGFQNNNGGFALRNEFVKCASMPNGSTFLDNSAKDIAVFEGFFDFLSYKTHHLDQQEPPRNHLILNSSVFFEEQLPLMQSHNKVYLYLDNDNRGNESTTLAHSIDKDKFIDQRHLYKHYNDFNDWHRKKSVTLKSQIKIRL